ncbi:hypothetical protein JP0252_11690 [Helicobacter pylori]
MSPEEIRERAQKIAKKELDNDAKLAASHDQYERMKKSGLINPKELDSCIQADSLEELNQKRAHQSLVERMRCGVYHKPFW